MLKSRFAWICIFSLAVSAIAWRYGTKKVFSPMTEGEPLRVRLALLSGVEAISWELDAEVSLENHSERNCMLNFSFTAFDSLKFELLDQDGKSLDVSHEYQIIISEFAPAKPVKQTLEPGKSIRTVIYPLAVYTDLQKQVKDESYYQIVAIMNVVCSNEDGTTTTQILRSNPSTFRIGKRDPSGPAAHAAPGP